MRSVPFSFVAGLSQEYGAVECFWRESEVSFTGFVAEVWFAELPREFAIKWARVVKYSVKIRSVQSCSAPAQFAVSVPVVVPQGKIALGYASRGSKVQLSK